MTVHGSDPDVKIRQGASSSSGSGLLAYENVDGNGTPRSIAKIQGRTAGNGGYGELIFQTAFNNSLSERLRITKEGAFGVAGYKSWIIWSSINKYKVVVQHYLDNNIRNNNKQ